MSSRKGKGPPARGAIGGGRPLAAPEIPTRRPIDVYVGARLRHLREASRMTLSEVSIEAAIPEESIARYKCGEQRPSPTDIIVLARLFGIGLHELFPENPGQITGQLH
jgi:Helix-turn-helix domain